MCVRASVVSNKPRCVHGSCYCLDAKLPEKQVVVVEFMSVQNTKAARLNMESKLTSRLCPCFLSDDFQSCHPYECHFEIDRASDHRMSGLPIRAKYKHFKTICEETCENSPTVSSSSSISDGHPSKDLTLCTVAPSNLVVFQLLQKKYVLQTSLKIVQ